MEPRKSVVGPLQSTSVPQDFLSQVREALQEAFGDRLKDRKLYLEGRIFPTEIILSVGLKPDPKGLRQINFEASADYTVKNLMEQMGLCADAISSMLEQYLDADGDIEFPLIWTKFEINKKAVYLQTSGRNTELEAAADRILGVDPNKQLYTPDGEDRDVTEELEQLLKKSEEGDDEGGGSIH